MRTAVWLYLFIFIAFFDLHAQYPILTPFAVSLGAAPSFIGLTMGIYSITHLPGNIIAGVAVDRYGSKYFIVASLLVAGILLLVQAHIVNPWQLLVIRSISGFVLAFLSPACLAMLAKLARDYVHQGKLMTGKGLVHTLAAVVSPAAGSLLVAQIGFTHAFSVLGWILIITAFIALMLRETGHVRTPSDPVTNSLMDADSINDSTNHPVKKPVSVGAIDARSPIGETTVLQERRPSRIPWILFAIPLALSCSQGMLFFEVPFLHLHDQSLMSTGWLFTIVSLGSLVTLSMMFINRYLAYYRAMMGTFVLALAFFIMSVNTALPIEIPLFVIGMAKGVMYPAIATMFASMTSADRYGRIFSVLSISYSIGSFIGPLMAGYARDYVSPYFLAFVVLMMAMTVVPATLQKTEQHIPPPVHSP